MRDIHRKWPARAPVPRPAIALAAALLLGALLAGGVAHADRRAALGSYEQEALDYALAARGLAIEPAPAGKVLGQIHVVNLEVFDADTSFLTWLNLFHRTTRARVIEREVLLRPGQVWDDAVVEDSLRRLRDPLFSALVVMMPVRAGAPGQVDLLVVTRDIWSLRLNTLYELQGTTLSTLVIAPSENNLMGWRKQLAMVYTLDLGDYEVGPYYLDKNVGGTRLQLGARGALIFARDSDTLEGVDSSLELVYPLWSLSRAWGAALNATHRDAVVRDFQGPVLRPYDNPDTAEQEAIPWRYEQRATRIEANATRALGRGTKHHLTAGYELRIDRRSLPADFPDDDALRAAFARDVLGRSERSSALVLRYNLFTPAFATYRNVDTFDLPEEVRLGPDLRAEVAVARRLLGSEQDFARLAAGLSWTWELGGGGFARAALESGGRVQGGELIDRQLAADVVAASPTLWGALRLVGRADADACIPNRRSTVDEQICRFVLGGESGLRGYRIGEFAGNQRVRANLEARTMPVRVWFSRVGALAFWDAGHAAGAAGELRVHHDVGAGVRVLIPQLQPAVFRVDWAVPLTGDTAGLPGRFIAGAEQVF